MIRRSVRTQMPAKVEILPGMLLMEVSRRHPTRRHETETFVQPHSVRGGMATGRFALPSDGPDVEDPTAPYPVGAQVQTVLPGDELEFEVLLASDEIVFVNSPLVSGGDGTLVHYQSSPGAAKIICHAKEDIDLTGLPARLIKARTRIQ